VGEAYAGGGVDQTALACSSLGRQPIFVSDLGISAVRAQNRSHLDSFLLIIGYELGEHRSAQ
jgi:hypothetical protein